MRGGPGNSAGAPSPGSETAAARWGTPPWRVDVSLPSTEPPRSCDLAVVGAGLTGLACGVVGARRGFSVAVLEAGRVGAGSSGRTGGVVLEETAAGPLEGVTACLPALGQTVRALGIECDLRIGGCWELVHKADRESGEPGWMDGGKRVVVGEVVPGGTLDPGRLLSGLARAVIDAGGSIVEGSAVRAIHPGPPVTLELSRGTLVAQHVVLALNAFTQNLVPELEEIHPALTLALCTEPLDPETISAIGLGQGTPFYTADLPYLWGSPLPDGRVIFGSGLAFDPSDDLSRIDVREGDAAAVLGSLEERVRRLHPLLVDVRISTRWGGPVAFSRDRRPFLAPLTRAPHVLVTGAYAGHGIALGVRIGELAAEWIAGEVQLPPWAQEV